MYAKGVVIGRVVGIEPSGDERRPDLLILENREKNEYPSKIACEFFYKNKALLGQVRNGELVEVVGAIKSAPGQRGGWFTHFNCFSLSSLSHFPEANQPQYGRGQEEENDHEASKRDRLPF